MSDTSVKTRVDVRILDPQALRRIVAGVTH